MRKFTLLFACILCITSTQFAQNSLMWEITGKDLKEPSYLFGTIHLIGKKDFFMPKQVEEKFKSCSVLATEVNLDMSLQEKIDIAMKTLLPDNKTIKDYVSEEEYSSLRTHMIDEVGIKEKKADKYMRLKPFFLSSIITKEQLGKTMSYEEEFVKMAKKNKMNTTGLESINYQMDVIGSISVEHQVELLKEGLKEDETGVDQFTKMVEMYKAQNLEALYSYTTEESDDIPDFKKNFLDTRNSNWIPEIEKLAQQNATFIAVGAAHLWGDTGVITLLKNAGYTVNPVK